MLQVDTCRQGPDFTNKYDHTKRQVASGFLASWQVGLLCSVVDLLWGKLDICSEILTESNLSRLQVNFKEFQCHGGEFFQWGA